MPRLSIREAPQREREAGALPFPDLEAMLIRLLESGDSGAVDMVDALLSQALLHRASDLHIEPWADCVAVRLRIDGILHVAARIPQRFHGQMVNRFKVLARILTYQKDLPQDGRIDPETTPCHKAMRVSTFPTVYGEKLVVRLLDADPNLFSLDALGFRPDMVATLRAALARPQGTLLLTGPSSSGKTTTIYALISELLQIRKPAPHVVTIEDPVEYRFGNVSQTEVNPYAGFTFAAALRAVVRQDPEVIMLGEVRDPETAHAAIQAGLTGHMVISTIHSGTAAGVFTRLLDMGIEPYLVASSVTGVLSQRLLRRTCVECGGRGEGCDTCKGIGYRGRIAVGELLPVNDAIAALILQRSRTNLIHEAAVRAGMMTVAEDAAERVKAGITTMAEVRRILPVPEPNAAPAMESENV
jgi:type II secretory ATPase GspE/PulE/Tfp pilus assembly ATPase PilB-like protein